MKFFTLKIFLLLIFTLKFFASDLNNNEVNLKSEFNFDFESNNKNLNNETFQKKTKSFEYNMEENTIIKSNENQPQENYFEPKDAIINLDKISNYIKDFKEKILSKYLYKLFNLFFILEYDEYFIRLKE